MKLLLLISLTTLSWKRSSTAASVTDDHVTLTHDSVVTLTPDSVVATSGSSAEFTCSVTSSAAGTINWIINSVPVTSDESLEKVSAGANRWVSTLTVSALTPGDDGTVVQCSAVVGNTLFSSQRVDIRVLSVNLAVVSKYALQGIPLSLRCLVMNGNIALPSIQWYKNDKIFSNDKVGSVIFSAEHNQYISELHIPSTECTDGGVYKCKAIWRLQGEKQTSSESEGRAIEVLGVVFMTPSSEIKVGDSFTITCAIDSVPGSVIMWRRNGVAIDKDGYTQKRGQYLVEYLEIKSAESLGTWTYECGLSRTESVQNAKHSAFKSMNLTVYQSCPVLSNPIEGRWECSGNTCYLKCNPAYVSRDTDVMIVCVDGNWTTTSTTVICDATTTPLTRVLTHEIEISCSSPWISHIEAAYPQFLRLLQSHVQGVRLELGPEPILGKTDDIIDMPERCSTLLTFNYSTLESTDDGKLRAKLGEIKTFIEETDFMTILDEHVSQSSDGVTRIKRSGVVGVVSSAVDVVECPEFTVLRNGFCAICGDGWIVAGGKCVPCPLGSYQDEMEPNTCKSCPTGLSTLSSASTSAMMCVEVCRVRKPSYASVHPPQYTLVTTNSDVTVLCDAGFTLPNGERQDTFSCAEKTECSRITLTDTPEFIIRPIPFNFTCIVESGVQVDQCHLVRDSSVIQTTDITTDHDRQLCVFSEEFLEDSARYYCIASSDSVELTSTKKTILHLKPIVTVAEIVVPISEPLHLLCSAIAPAGYSVLMWWKKHNTIISQKTYAVDGVGVSVHTVPSPKITESGSYICETKFIGVGISESDPVVVKVIGFVEGLSDFALLEGEQVTVSCSMPFAEYGPSISWFKDGEVVENDGTYLTENNNQLLVSKLVVRYGGVYQCKATTSGRDILSEGKVTLASNAFLRHPESQVVISGGSITFQCEFSDISAEIAWRLDGLTMGTSVKETNQFTIDNVQEDAMVQCVATTVSGDRFYSKQARATVRRFLTHPSDTILIAGEAALYCSIIGPGVVGITWQNTDGEIQEGTSVEQVTPVEYRSTLTTSSEGKYHCVALFGDDVTLISDKGETVSYSVSITDNFVLMRHGFRAQCEVTGPLPPVAIAWNLNTERLFEDDDVVYDGHQGVSESSYYFTSLSDREIGEVQCTAIFGTDFLQITSPKKSLAPLGITRGPSSARFLKNSPALEFDLYCEFFDYAEVDTTVTWNTDGLIHQSHVTRYIDDNIVQSTLSVQVVEHGDYDVVCTIDYGDHGTAVSDKADIVVLLPNSLAVTSELVGYGSIAEAKAVIPKLSDSVEFEFTINGVVVEAELSDVNDSYIVSYLRWPLVLDSEITLNVDNGQEVWTQTSHVKAFGIKHIEMNGAVTNGGSLDLTCSISEDPQSDEIYWHFMSEKMMSTSHSSSGNTIKSVLSLSDLNESMYGLYACVTTYHNKRPMSKHIAVIPASACILPTIANGIFLRNYLPSDESIIPSCSKGFVLSNENHAVLCRDGHLIGDIPKCLYVEEEDNISIMVTLIVCAFVTMTCFTTISVYYCLKTHGSGKGLETVRDESPYPASTASKVQQPNDLLTTRKFSNVQLTGHH